MALNDAGIERYTLQQTLAQTGADLDVERLNAYLRTFIIGFIASMTGDAARTRTEALKSLPRAVEFQLRRQLVHAGQLVSEEQRVASGFGSQMKDTKIRCSPSPRGQCRGLG